MTDDEWDAIEGADGWVWVWNNPNSVEQRVGATHHSSRRAAIRAGKQWLAKKEGQR